MRISIAALVGMSKPCPFIGYYSWLPQMELESVDFANEVCSTSAGKVKYLVATADMPSFLQDIALLRPDPLLDLV